MRQRLQIMVVSMVAVIKRHYFMTLGSSLLLPVAFSRI